MKHDESGQGLLTVVVLFAAIIALFSQVYKINYFQDKSEYLTGVEMEVESIRTMLDETFSCERTFKEDGRTSCAAITKK